MGLEKIVIQSKKHREVIDITDTVQKLLDQQNHNNGLCNLFLMHTTAALTTADLDPGGTDLDMMDAFEGMIPKLKYRHPHNPEHMPDHILSSLVGTSLTIPVEKRKLILGTWQRIVLIERDGPRERTIIVSCVEK